MKLTLVGRSPIEAVNVPSYIPKDTSSYYSNAIVAHQSGQTLAGLFLLRTFIEQTARKVVANGSMFATGDELMEAYGKTLHVNVRGEFPSMAKLYSDLSADIHLATGSAELFEDAIKQINAHFEAKALYKKVGK